MSMDSDTVHLFSVTEKATNIECFVGLFRGTEKIRKQSHYSAVITYRGDRIRLISVRRARKEEVKIYEG